MKDTFYTHLLDEIKDDECPICRSFLKGTKRYLDYLLYENVNDGGTRASFLESDGFCEYHAKLMLHHGDLLGHALLYDL